MFGYYFKFKCFQIFIEINPILLNKCFEARKRKININLKKKNYLLFNNELNLPELLDNLLEKMENYF